MVFQSGSYYYVAVANVPSGQTAPGYVSYPMQLWDECCTFYDQSPSYGPCNPVTTISGNPFCIEASAGVVYDPSATTYATGQVLEHLGSYYTCGVGPPPIDPLFSTTIVNPPAGNSNPLAIPGVANSEFWGPCPVVYGPALSNSTSCRQNKFYWNPIGGGFAAPNFTVTPVFPVQQGDYQIFIVHAYPGNNNAPSSINTYPTGGYPQSLAPGIGLQQPVNTPIEISGLANAQVRVTVNHYGIKYGGQLLGSCVYEGFGTSPEAAIEQSPPTNGVWVNPWTDPNNLAAGTETTLQGYIASNISPYTYGCIVPSDGLTTNPNYDPYCMITSTCGQPNNTLPNPCDVGGY